MPQEIVNRKNQKSKIAPMFKSSIANILINLNAESPEKIIITEGEKRISVGEIYQDALKIAKNLQNDGFQTGDKVAIAAPPNAEFVKIMYALIFLKGTVAIIDPEMGRDNYRSKLKQFDPKWAFVDSRLLLLQEHPIIRFLHFKKSKTAPYFPYTSSAKIIACGLWLPLLQKKTFLNKWLKSNPIDTVNWQEQDDKTEQHEFLITYTSGTIAEPKGVVHTFDSLFNSLQLIGNQFDTNKENLIATYLPHYMLIGFSVKMPSILYDQKMSALDKIDFFEKNKVTTIMGPPSDFVPMIEFFEKTKSKFPSTLQHILLGSAPVTRRFLQRLSDVLPLHTRITCLYGMTENLLVATIDGRIKKDYDCEGDLLGKPAKGVQIKIEDDEILLNSNQLFARYFLMKKTGDFHPTGDLGKLDKEGNVILTGRKKDMIIRRNLNIYPAIYEATVNQIEGVTEGILVGVYDDILHDEKVYLVIEGDAKLSKSNILQQLKTGKYSIDMEAIPDEVLFMKLPRNGRQHKVNKQEIRDFIKKNQL
jgi:acyl-CoA synthetase (AMP-forming)/AMP-acid ligase II